MINRVRLFLPVLALVALAVNGLPAAADTATSATVVMGETGYSPAAVAIQPGGAVTWVNKGANVHTATSIGGAPLGFDTGGLGNGQSITFNFQIPGKYYYTSATDCMNGQSIGGFPCSGSFLVDVSSAAVVAAVAQATAVAQPVARPTRVTQLNSPALTATVLITDTGISPAVVTIVPYGSVTFINQGTQVHTATNPGSPQMPQFDTGGLGPGQVANVPFGLPNTFTYTSAPDCLNNNRNPGFNCGPYSIVISTDAAANVQVAAPAPVVAAAGSNASTQYGWRPKGVNEAPLNCGSSQKFLGWLLPHNVPCLDSAPNAGTQYIQGHVLDAYGNGVGGMIVRATAYGNNYDGASDQDGTFSIILSGNCPFENRTYSVYIIDGLGQKGSEAQIVNYQNCNLAGEFHFDFVRTS